MKSSDYFSNVYEPERNKTVSYWEQRAIIDAEKEAELENMLDWLYDTTEKVFSCIPESTLTSFKPAYIDIRFFRNKSGNYINVRLVKYRKERDAFGDLYTDQKNFKMPFINFESVPEIYRNNWEDALIILRRGNFEAYDGFYKKRHGNIGKYKAVYDDSCNLETKFFSHYSRKL